MSTNKQTSGQHRMAAGGPQVDTADDLSGASGYEAAKAHSVWRAATNRGQERLAQQAKEQYAAQRYGAQTQLRRDEAERLDDTVMSVARQNLVALGDLMQRGLTIDLDLAAHKWTFERVDDTSAADVTMAGTTGGNEDVPDFDEVSTPLPLAHKSFYFHRRKLEASRTRGEPLDTTMAAQSTRQVRETLEDGVFNGYDVTVDGDSPDGYTTHSQRGQVTGNATWDGATADNMIDDVMRTIEAIEDQNKGGAEIMFYIDRQGFQEIRAKNAGTDDKRGVLQLVRDRLESEADFPGVQFKRADYLDDGEAVAVEMSPETVELAVVSDFQTVEWESDGGWTIHNKVLAGMTPVLKSDRNNNIGIAHLTGI